MDSQHLVRGFCAHLTDSTSGKWIVIYLAEARNSLFGGLGSMLAETIIFRPEDTILHGWVKSSVSGWRTQFMLRKFQLLGDVRSTLQNLGAIYSKGLVQRW